MAEPMRRSPELEAELEQTFGFRTADYIRQNLYVPPLFGCGRPVEGFRDEISEADYRITGMCQRFQDAFYQQDES